MNEQGDPQCECPTLDENDEEEVCGMAVYGVSVTRKTWENERFLRRHACVTDADDYVVSHKGPCGGNTKAELILYVVINTFICQFRVQTCISMHQHLLDP